MPVVVIQSVSVPARNGADEVIAWMKRCWHNIKKLFADGGYSSKLIKRIKTLFDIDVEIVKRSDTATFNVLAKRWIVERTFAC